MRSGAAAIVAGALIGMVTVLALSCCKAAPVADRQDGVPIVVERTAAPPYLQKDERWGGLPYADGTISDCGSGLCVAAMAASACTGEDIDPPTLLNLVGNTCTTGGESDMGKYCDALASLYGIECTGRLEGAGQAERYLGDGWLLMCQVSGRLYEDGRDYGPRAVLAYATGSDVGVNDPMDVCLGGVTMEQFAGIDMECFYAVRKAS